MATDNTSPYIDMWTDYEPEVLVQSKNSAREWAANTTLAGAEFRISATEQGAAIAAGVTVAAAHNAGAPGHYSGSIDLNALQSALPALTYPHGSVVYLQFRKANDVDVEAFAKRVRRHK